jgi:hypothetical protein
MGGKIMMKARMSILASTACALLLAIPLTAANGPAASTNNHTNKKMTATATMRTAWTPQTLTGKIATVDPDRKLVVVKDSSGVPFDMVVTAKTRIKAGDQTITLKDLTRDMNKTVSLQYIPERSGDVAKSIRING